MSGSDSIRVLAGECTVIERDGGDERERRGRVVVVVKPDDTVLVHDRDGYQPVAWLTRADAVVWGAETAPDAAEGGFTLTARKDDQRLWVAAHDEDGLVSYPASVAGIPVGDCPSCGERLVRSGREVACLACERSHGLPRDATVRERTCECGLPRLRVERGTAFDLCLDRECPHSTSLDEAVREAFDREWACPDCGSDLRVVRKGGLLVGCDRYPECETGFSMPTGTVADDCGCGLPTFETPTGQRCLDSACELEG
jgi:DNA topoisomerase-1